MFREMRRRGNALTHEETVEMLKKNTNGVLAVMGDDGYPYAVPLSYVYADNKIFFHSAIEGHKLDAIENMEKVSFCVVEQDNIIPEDFNTLFRSAIAFGKAKIITDEKEKNLILNIILQKYSPEFLETGKKYIEQEFNNCKTVKIDIEHLTGKAGD